MLQQGTIKHPPGRVFESKYADKPAQRSVTVEWNGSVADCWFNVGHDFEFFKAGDPVFFTIKTGQNGKARADIQLTEAMAETLKQRRAAAGPPSAPSDAPPPGTVPAGNKSLAPYHEGERWSADHRRLVQAEIERRAKVMKFCFEEVSRQLPEEEDITVTNLAIALYQDVSKLF